MNVRQYPESRGGRHRWCVLFDDEYYSRLFEEEIDNIDIDVETETKFDTTIPARKRNQQHAFYQSKMLKWLNTCFLRPYSNEKWNIVK
jgi:hypothetical protein